MNKIILLGRITKDPALTKTTTGQSLIRFDLAVKRKRVKEGNVDTDFFNCIAFEKIAENIYQYVGKGSQVLIEGRVQLGSYQTKDNKKVKTVSVMVENIHFIETKSSRAEKQAVNDYVNSYDEQNISYDDITIYDDEVNK